MSQRENLEAFLEHEEHLRMLAKNGEDGFMKEFMALKQQSMRYKTEKTYSTSEGEKEGNIRKNRYKDILPFDYTRITLPEIEDVEGSDYINANYISGMGNKSVYIAAQGPLPHTVNDFWRLLWETGVEIVIMACNEYENGKHKCEKYWSDEGETKQFGSIAVILIRQLRVTQDFMIRTLKASKDGEERVLNQFHYTAWPDHGVPRTVQPIMDMIKLFREYLPGEDLPVVMHCSAGCGRTGTMICIDYVRALLKAGMIGSDFCLYDIIMEMRRQRPAIVQTRDQYELVHRAVAWLFRKELGMAHNPSDYDHLYENVKLQNEGPRMPPAAGSLSPDIRTTPPFKQLSPKQRRHKDKETDMTHNYVNHTIQGKVMFDGSGGSSAAKALKPPSLPTKQQSREADSETIYANFQERPDVEEKGGCAEESAALTSPAVTSPAVTSPALTPRQSPLAQERYESGCKKIVAAFKEFEMPPSQGQGRASPPRSISVEPAKPRPHLKPTPSSAQDARKTAASRSLDLDLALPKPPPPSKPVLADKPALADKPKPNAKPNLLAKPALARKKDGGAGAGPLSGAQPTPIRRRPTSEPLSHSTDQGKVHLGASQFKHAKNLVEAKLTKPDGDSGHKDADTGKRKERAEPKARPSCAPPKPPVALAKHPGKQSPGKTQAYEEVCIPDSSATADKHDSSSPRGFSYQIQPVSAAKLQSHRDMVEGKPGRSEPHVHRVRTIDPSRPMQATPGVYAASAVSSGEEYSYAVQPISVAEKLKDAQSRPQLRTGQALAYADAYTTETKDPASSSAASKEPATRITEDYSYASEVVIPIAPGKARGNVKKFPLQKAKSTQGDAYEIIEVNGPPPRRSSEGMGQEESPVFDKSPGEYNELSIGQTGATSGTTGAPRHSTISSSTSWASFTDDEEEDEPPPSLPVKTAGAYEYVEGEGGDESGAGASSKQKITQFLSNQRDKISNHREKLASNTKGFFKQIGVARGTPTVGGSQSSPQATLSSSPQAAIVSDLNELIKKTLREYEPTYKEEPTMFNKFDISFPKRVPKPKTPPPPPNGWSKPDTTSVHL